ncbi:hypothetical protein C8R44DRAFT_747706 [Mycena epipterygia]|nr:hypothetical protein C8R44DRAFT_747706 [Mycena epipterygia]
MWLLDSNEDIEIIFPSLTWQMKCVHHTAIHLAPEKSDSERWKKEVKKPIYILTVQQHLDSNEDLGADQIQKLREHGESAPGAPKCTQCPCTRTSHCYPSRTWHLDSNKDLGGAHPIELQGDPVCALHHTAFQHTFHTGPRRRQIQKLREHGPEMNKKDLRNAQRSLRIIGKALRDSESQKKHPRKAQVRAERPQESPNAGRKNPAKFPDKPTEKIACRPEMRAPRSSKTPQKPKRWREKKKKKALHPLATQQRLGSNKDLGASQQRLGSNKDLGVNINIRFRLKETPRPNSKAARARRKSPRPRTRNAHTEIRPQSHDLEADSGLSWGRARPRKKSIGHQQEPQQHLDSNEDLGVLRFRSPAKGNPACTIHHTAFMVPFRTWRNAPGMTCLQRAFRKCTEKNHLDSELSSSPEMTEQRYRTKKYCGHRKEQHLDSNKDLGVDLMSWVNEPRMRHTPYCFLHPISHLRTR